MFSLERTLIGLAVVAAVLTGTYVTGYWKGWNASEKLWLAEKSEMISAARLREERLRADGAHLAASLEVARANIRVEVVEKLRTVYVTASKVKSCFSPDVTAALNRNSVIVETRTPIGLPGGDARPSLVIEHKPAAEPMGSSEQAVASWVAEAQASHAMCRAQVVRLTDWIKAATTRVP